MRVALVNPAWSFEGSIYFGCRHPHLPLELGYARALLEAAGHEVSMLDGLLQAANNTALAQEVADWHADLTVVATAPTYLFWRCAQPELTVPMDFLAQLGCRGGRTLAIGPHGSVTPAATLRKLGVDIVVMGEPEDVLADIAANPERTDMPATALRFADKIHINGTARASNFVHHRPLVWPDNWIKAHTHHHHRFDDGPRIGYGAEVEASRGCPYNCSFCAKIEFRDAYRRRRLGNVLQEIDVLISQGVGYIYFIDEIFLPQKPLLEALSTRPIKFGVQTRIDLWKPQMLELLGEAGCVSLEAGLESLTIEGRAALAKRCRLDTPELAELLIHARRYVPFVQANLIGVAQDDAALVSLWRERLISQGVWANDPVPLYPYPSSPAYRALWGQPDDEAWERAQAHYLRQFATFSDIQDQKPLSLEALEDACCPRH